MQKLLKYYIQVEKIEFQIDLLGKFIDLRKKEIIIRLLVIIYYMC